MTLSRYLSGYFTPVKMHGRATKTIQLRPFFLHINGHSTTAQFCIYVTQKHIVHFDGTLITSVVYCMYYIIHNKMQNKENTRQKRRYILDRNMAFASPTIPVYTYVHMHTTRAISYQKHSLQPLISRYIHRYQIPTCIPI